MIDLAVKLVGFDAMAETLPTFLPARFRVGPSDLADAADVHKWIRSAFSRRWAGQYFDACEQGKGLHATDAAGDVIGFAAWDVPRLGYFGPLGVAESARGNVVGKALTILALAAMEKAGYGVALIHHVGPIEFYSKFLQFNKIKW